MELYKKLLLLCLASSTVPLGAGERLNPLAYAQQIAQSAHRAKQFKKSPEEDKIAMQMELQRTLQELPGFMNELEQGLEEEDYQGTSEAVDAVMWQNTLLGSVKLPLDIEVGLYKGDIAGLSLLAADAASDVLLYKHLTKKRVEFVYNAIKNDCGGFIRSLISSLKLEEEYEKKLGDAPVDQNYIQLVACAPLKNYLAEHHRLIRNFPLNKELLAPLVLRWGWEKVSAALHERFFPDFREVDPSLGAMFLKELEGQAFISKDGELLSYEDLPPFSVSSMISRLVNAYNFPVRTCVSAVASTAWGFLFPSANYFRGLFNKGGSSGTLEFLNSTVGFYIPQCFFSKTSGHIFDFLGIGFGAQYFDATLSARWNLYVVQNRKKLKILLDKYKESLLVTGKQEDRIKLEKEIREFVEEGHKQESSWFPLSLAQQWQTFRQLGASKLSLVTGAWVAGVSLLKGAKFYYDNFYTGKKPANGN